MNKLRGDQTPEAAHAELMVEGIGQNAIAAVEFSQRTMGTLDLSESMAALVTLGHRASDGDLATLEALLAAQAVTLNAMFTQFARQAAAQTKVDTQAIQRWRPWEHSTGPRGAEGKARSARNADRGGQREQFRAMMRNIRAFLKEQEQTIAGIRG